MYIFSDRSKLWNVFAQSICTLIGGNLYNIIAQNKWQWEYSQSQILWSHNFLITFLNPICLEWVPIRHPLLFSHYLRHGFAEANRVKVFHLSVIFRFKAIQNPMTISEKAILWTIFGIRNLIKKLHLMLLAIWGTRFINDNIPMSYFQFNSKLTE